MEQSIDVQTVDNGDFSYKVCRCFVCKIEKAATFAFEFFPASKLEPTTNLPYLVCQDCVQTQVLPLEPETRPKKKSKKKGLWEVL